MFPGHALHTTATHQIFLRTPIKAMLLDLDHREHLGALYCLHLISLGLTRGKKSNCVNQIYALKACTVSAQEHVSQNLNWHSLPQKSAFGVRDWYVVRVWVPGIYLLCSWCICGSQSIVFVSHGMIYLWPTQDIFVGWLQMEQRGLCSETCSGVPSYLCC